MCVCVCLLGGVEWEEREERKGGIFTSELAPTNRITRQQRRKAGVDVRG